METRHEIFFALGPALTCLLAGRRLDEAREFGDRHGRVELEHVVELVELQALADLGGERAHVAAVGDQRDVVRGVKGGRADIDKGRLGKGEERLERRDVAGRETGKLRR